MFSANPVSKGIVQVGGVSYRIVRLAASAYSVFRISDDREVGRFKTKPKISLEPLCIDAQLLHSIAREAGRAAKTSGVGHAIPQAPARPVTARPRASEAAPADPPSRVASTVPPRSRTPVPAG